jgi:ribosomal protein L7/L12
MDNRYFTGEQNAEARLSEIAYLLQAGKKVQAIKVYREITGASLSEAKTAIERIEMTGILEITSAQAGSAPLAGSITSPGIPTEPLAEMARLIAQNKKIQAIKLYREYTGSGLTYAKDVVEQIEREMRSQGF